MSEAEEVMNGLRLALRRCIDDAGLSQAEVAETLGITPKHMCAMLIGRAQLTIPWAVRIAGVCGCEMSITLGQSIRARAGITEATKTRGETE